MIEQNWGQALDGDIERVSSAISEENEDDEVERIMVLINSTETGEQRLTVHPTENVLRAVTRQTRLARCLVHFGDEPVMNGSFEDNGIEDGARLDVFPWTGYYREVVADLIRLNHETSSSAGIKRKLIFNPDGSLKSWDLSGLGLESLPESFGQLELTGSLLLSSNGLRRLPESFCQVRIGGMLDLGSNELVDLPPNFGEIMADPIYLAWNPITQGETNSEIRERFAENCFDELCAGLNVILY